MGRKAPLFLILAAIVMSSTNCSGMWQQTYLQAEVAGTEWVELHPTGPYKYEANSVTLLLCRSSVAGGFISWGPTFLFPIVPGFLIRDPLQFEIIIENPLDVPVILDTSKIKVELPNYGWTWPRHIAISEKAVDSCEPYSLGNKKVGGKSTLPKGKRMISLDFQLHIDPNFELDVGSISVNGKDYEIPRLKYKKICNEISYYPLAARGLGIPLKKCE